MFDGVAVYDEESDTDYWPQGWYEQIDNWEELSSVMVHEGEVTCWVPLPEFPE